MYDPVKSGRLIDALGGTSAVAKALEVDPQVVSNWRKRGVSLLGRYKLGKLAKRKRIHVPSDLMDAFDD